MPKIRIREKDHTASSILSADTNTVFLTDSKASEKPVLLTDGSDVSSYANASIISSIINLGGQVVVAKSYTAASDYLKDRNQFDIKFLLAKEDEIETNKNNKEDEIETNNKTTLELALDIASSRRDCVVVYWKTTNSYTDAEKTLLDQAVGGDSFLSKETGKRGKYCLPFYAESLKDTSGKTAQEFSSAVSYILAFLNSIKNGNAEWLAVAGSKRGSIPSTTLTVEFMTESQIDEMQPRDEGRSINPIVNMNPWGIRIWGNRTAETIVSNKGLQASHFANLRILICDIKKRLYKAARQYQFEQNNDVLWVNFTSTVNELLEEMEKSYGIAGYRWIREETGEKAKLSAILKIIPVEPVEDFDLTIDLTDSLEISE